jgi:hypothetical protein
MQPTRSDFLREVFQHTEGDVWLGSLCNDKRDGGEKSLASRDASEIEPFVDKWDQAGRGVYFCVGTVTPGQVRNKQTVMETVALHSDIDQKDILIGRDEVLGRLTALPYRPSIVVDSGRGTHVYWLLREASVGEAPRIERALQRLRDILAGDHAPCHTAAYMRLPGTHNTKDGGWRPVGVVGGTWQRYELSDLEEWLADQPLVIERKPISARAKPVNPFNAYLTASGAKPRIDVEALLAGISPGNVHNTQLSVTAALICRGADIDEVVATVLAATERVGEPDWDWRREERDIRRMCESWLNKRRP